VLAVSVAYAATVVLFVLANKLTTAANAIFIQDTAPLYVVLLSPFVTGERASRSELVALPLFLLGLGLFFLDQLTPSQVKGNLLALAAGVAFASLMVGMRAVGEESVAAVLYGNLLAGAVGLPFALQGPAPTVNDWLLLVYLGVFQLGLAYALFARGLRGISAVEASLLVLLEPVMNPIWAFLLAGEVPGKWAMVGGSIILAATLWRTLAPSTTQSRPAT
jgi:drug/metabolite transporter, DME family